MNHHHRARLLLAGFVVVSFAALGWYGTQIVRPPDCAIAVSAFTGGDGQPLPENGEEVTWSELEERAYREMVASGRCEPPEARWHHWFS